MSEHLYLGFYFRTLINEFSEGDYYINDNEYFALKQSLCIDSALSRKDKF